MRVLEPQVRVGRIAATHVVGMVEDPVERSRQGARVAAVPHRESVGQAGAVPERGAAQCDRSEEEGERERRRVG